MTKLREVLLTQYIGAITMRFCLGTDGDRCHFRTSADWLQLLLDESRFQ